MAYPPIPETNDPNIMSITVAKAANVNMRGLLPRSIVDTVIYKETNMGKSLAI
jgi:hypothetical protein